MFYSTHRNVLNKGYIRSDIFNGIMTSTIFPSLADVFTEAILTEEYFQAHEQVQSRVMAETMEYRKALNEKDFLNQHVLDIGKADSVTNIVEGSNIHELTQPDDLMIPLMWPNVYDGQGGETLYVEYEIEVPPEETEVNYPNSPGSAGDISDFSETSSGPENESCSSSDGLPSFDKVKVKSEPGVVTEPYLPVQSILSPSYDDDDDEDSYDDILEKRPNGKPKKRRKSDSEYLADGRKRPGRKKGQTSSVYHLWEFIRDLLHDPKQRIIKWENEQEGIFRVVKSGEVAKQWGNMKKNREKMTYEKLSRSLRYSRKEGYFEDVPKDGGYPKKLCFKFGPKSHGWKKI